ncbi:stage V sporulation protein AC [Clostridium hydrogenum]|uniref:stage V sporulation protein AC n=1 Tax=Clostridium hydrogenum TaxID=2855764 RepID=UPI001F308166|nr:stage V sporulation protein AC [Clostridium hydrogenum]
MKVSEEKIKKDFKSLSQNSKPKPKIIKNCICAFIIGGLICDVGQLVSDFFSSVGVPQDDLGTYTAIVMVFIGAFLTGIGIYDKIANIGGAGTVVPITGFANSIVAPAIEFKKEGFVFGVGAKMFTIAGPVLVYGLSSSVIVGIIYYFIMR